MTKRRDWLVPAALFTLSGCCFAFAWLLRCVERMEQRLDHDAPVDQAADSITKRMASRVVLYPEVWRG